MNNLRSILYRPVVGMITAGLVLTSFLSAAATVASAASADHATNDRLITLHDRGHERGILTQATTLRQAFKEAGVPLDDNDLVEPGLDEQLTASNYEANIYRARPVIIIDGNAREKIMTAYQTGEQIASHAGIVLHDEDKTTIDRVDDIVGEGAGLKLTVDRATPFTFVLYGKKVTAYSQATTVGDMLKEKNVTLGASDTLSVANTAPITSGMTVEVWRNGVQTVTEEQEIAAPVRQIKDTNKDVGYKEIQTPGKPGKKQVTYEINMQNGHEVSRKEIQSVVSLEPTEQVEVVGAKLPVPTNPSENAQLGHQMMLNAGFGEDQWPCLYALWTRESGWRVNAANPSGAYGIPQALPGSKMGGDWQTSASTQISWGLGYIKGRYSTPCNADSIQRSRGWY